MKPGMKTTLRTAAWSTSALLLMGAAAGTASAVTAHNNHSTSSSSDNSNAARPHLLHDIATVEESDGTFSQYATQIGKVTAVSDSSITVASADKYSATYAVDDGTHVMKDGNKAAIGDVATGDTVFVRAEDEDGTFTADVIGDGKPPAGHGPGGHRPPPPGGPGEPDGPGQPGGDEGGAGDGT